MANCPECGSEDFTPYWFGEDIDVDYPDTGEHITLTVSTCKVCWACDWSQDNEPITLKLTPENLERVIDACKDD